MYVHVCVRMCACVCMCVPWCSHYKPDPVSKHVRCLHVFYQLLCVCACVCVCIMGSHSHTWSCIQACPMFITIGIPTMTVYKYTCGLPANRLSRYIVNP